MNDLSVAWWCDRRLKFLPFRCRRVVRFVAVGAWLIWRTGRRVTWPIRYPFVWLEVTRARRCVERSGGVLIA